MRFPDRFVAARALRKTIAAWMPKMLAVSALTATPSFALDLELSTVQVQGGEVRFNASPPIPTDEWPAGENVQVVSTPRYIVAANLDDITFSRHGFFRYKVYVRPKPGIPGEPVYFPVNGDSKGLFPVQMADVELGIGEGGEGETLDRKRITLLVISAEATDYLIMPPRDEPAKIDLPGEAEIPLSIQNVLKTWPVSVVAFTAPESRIWYKSGLKVRNLRYENPEDFKPFDIRPGMAESMVVLRLVPDSSQAFSKMLFQRANALENEYVTASLDYKTPWGIQDSLDIKIPVRFVPSLPLLFLALVLGTAMGSILPVLAGRRRWAKWPRTFAVSLLSALIVEVLASVLVYFDSELKLFGIVLDPSLLGPAMLIGVFMGLLGFRSLDLLEKLFSKEDDAEPEAAR